MASNYMLILNVMKSEWSISVYSLCVCAHIRMNGHSDMKYLSHSVTTLIMQLLKSPILKLLCYLCVQVRCWDDVAYIIPACRVDDTCFESWQERGLVFLLCNIQTGSGPYPSSF